MKIKYIFQHITLRIAILYAIVFSMILIVLNASVLYGLKYYLIYQAIDQITSQAELIKNNFKELGENTSLSDINSLLSTPYGENIYIKIVNGSNGETIYISKGYKDITIPYNKYLNEPKKIDIGKKDISYINTTFKFNHQLFYIQVIKDMENEYFFLKLLFALMFIADLIGILVSFAAGYFVTKRALKPIDYMIKEVKEIDGKRLNKRLNIYSENDELARLAKTFNGMLDRLEDSFNRQNMFVSDASHELRTPISVIKGYTDMLDRWGKDDKAVLQESIDAIKKETSEMEDLIERLLILAKGDNKSINLNKEEFYLKDIIKDFLNEAKLVYKDRNFKITTSDKTKMIADKKLIKELIRIFIDNAVKYTNSNGNIEISSWDEGSKIYLRIKDDGIGIPKEEIVHIFDRFYRVDKARAKDTGGAGLGLAIAKLIIEEHNGYVNVNSEVNKGSDFLIAFPQTTNF